MYAGGYCTRGGIPLGGGLPAAGRDHISSHLTIHLRLSKEQIIPWWIDCWGLKKHLVYWGIMINHGIGKPTDQLQWGTLFSEKPKSKNGRLDTWVGGLEPWNFMTFHILGMSSSQLTNSIIFQRGWLKPPTSYKCRVCTSPNLRVYDQFPASLTSFVPGCQRGEHFNCPWDLFRCPQTWLKHHSLRGFPIWIAILGISQLATFEDIGGYCYLIYPHDIPIIDS